MSALSMTLFQQQRGSTRSSSYGLFATLERWWVDYLTWRLERAAIAQLWALSDRQLKDIRLHRSQIPSAVRGDATSLACPSTTADQLQLKKVYGGEQKRLEPPP
jgi:uncharacterized protein YjiS (DUF1127 family)